MNVGDIVEILDCDYRWTANGFVEHKPEFVGNEGIITAIDGMMLTVKIGEEEESLTLHKSSVKLIENE